MRPRSLYDSVSSLPSAHPFCGRGLPLVLPQARTSLVQVRTLPLVKFAGVSSAGDLATTRGSLNSDTGFQPIRSRNETSHMFPSLHLILLQPTAIRQGKQPLGTLGASPHDHLRAIGQPARQQGRGCLLAFSKLIHSNDTHPPAVREN